MKTVIVLIAFLFTVVCYASPPPDNVSATPYEVQFVIQDNAALSTPIAYEVQEVAFNYLGNSELFTYTEFVVDPEIIIQLPELQLMNASYYNLNEQKKPPAFYSNVGVNFQLNMQNCNYGYPFTGDTN